MFEENNKVLDESVDLRSNVPELIPYLEKNDKVINVSKFVYLKQSELEANSDEYLNKDITIIEVPSTLSNPIDALKRLTGVAVNEEESAIGKYGPSIGALATKENAKLKELNLFKVVFGRDSIYVADLCEDYPKLTETTILHLCEYQGTKFDDLSEEEPGKVIHELRSEHDPIAQKLTKDRQWKWPYYGNVDATPMFISLISKYCNKSGYDFLNKSFTDKEGKNRKVIDSLEKSLEWLILKLDKSSLNLLEFKRINPHGIENQMWRDSWDSFFHKDGTDANHEKPIAALQVQILAYDALINASEMFGNMANSLGNKDYFLNLRGKLQIRAEIIRNRVLKDFWVEDINGGYFCLGLDYDNEGNSRQIQVKTSDMGHVFNSRIFEEIDTEIEYKLDSIVNILLSPLMLNASGIRSLAKDEKHFKPGGYHTGNVWLWDTYNIAKGFEQYGKIEEAEDLYKRIESVIHKFNMYPEFANGGDDLEPQLNALIVDIWSENHKKINRIEQLPQQIQAWTVAAAVAMQKRIGSI